jgi:signal transduction histidine kinase
VAARTEDLNQALSREREVGEMKSRFTSLVSHEFRTPLGVIGSSAQILDRYLARLDDDERREHLTNIRDSVKRMAAMMEEMLVLSRVDSGRMEFKPEPIALGDFCRRLLDELHSAHGCSAAFEVAPEAEVPALADETLLRHILTNLLTNAHKYSPPGAPVHLTLARADGDAIFTIRDEGIGIPEADQARLFEAFHRASNVSHISGTGLGLVLVRRCCELHGGGVKVTSREGAGTTFTVRVPVFAEESSSSFGE